MKNKQQQKELPAYRELHFDFQKPGGEAYIEHRYIVDGVTMEPRDFIKLNNEYFDDSTGLLFLGAPEDEPIPISFTSSDFEYMIKKDKNGNVFIFEKVKEK